MFHVTSINLTIKGTGMQTSLVFWKLLSTRCLKSMFVSTKFFWRIEKQLFFVKKAVRTIIHICLPIVRNSGYDLWFFHFCKGNSFFKTSKILKLMTNNFIHNFVILLQRKQFFYTNPIKIDYFKITFHLTYPHKTYFI